MTNVATITTLTDDYGSAAATGLKTMKNVLKSTLFNVPFKIYTFLTRQSELNVNLMASVKEEVILKQ